MLDVSQLGCLRDRVKVETCVTSAGSRSAQRRAASILARPLLKGKLNLLLTWAIKLGLRLPTEPTLKWINSTWLVLSEDPRG
jgi:hypothetical protein